MGDYKVVLSDHFLENTLIDKSHSVGYAKKTMHRLNEFCSHNDIKTFTKVRGDEHGNLVLVKTNYGIDKINVLGDTPLEQVVLTEIDVECWCNCGITFGTILKSPSRDVDNPDKWTPQETDVYDVELCQQVYFVVFEKVVALDWFAHRDNEPKEINGEVVSTRPADLVYGVIGESYIQITDDEGNVEVIHQRFPDIDACDWTTYYLTSIEPTIEHIETLVTETSLEEYDDI